MRLQAIRAFPLPVGNQIELTWVNPDPDQYPGVRILRRAGAYPTSPDDGVVVAEGQNLPYTANPDGARLYRVLDRQLQGETVYYYSLFPYQGDPPAYVIERHNRAAAMATAPYDMAGRMYELLPRIYHRYDSAGPPPAAPLLSDADRQRGQLRRFLDLPGGQLDQIYSFARAMLDLHDIDRVDGRLLPLLAQWIGWQTDYRLAIDAQRNELRQAPFIYETIGIVPTLEATVKRVLGWESRTKELVHNVCLTNRPPRLNIWSRRQLEDNTWSEPVHPISLDFAYAGRLAAVAEDDQHLWLFYHTARADHWDIWYKTLFVFGIDAALRDGLDRGIVSVALQQAFANEGLLLSQHATIGAEAGAWRITDTENNQTYTVREEPGQLHVEHWAPSRPLTNRERFDRHPTAVRAGAALWVFWDVYDPAGRTWRIDYRTHREGAWSAIATFGGAAPAPERRQPRAAVDGDGSLWLFWMERAEATHPWQWRYNRYDDPATALDPAGSFSFDSELGRQVRDLFVLSREDGAQTLWVFWAQQEPVGNLTQTEWRIYYRTKQSLDPAAADWTAAQPLAAPGYDSGREPAALLDDDGNIELYWSSGQGGSWSLWRSTLDVAADSWDPAERLTGDPYSERDPLPVSLGGRTWLIYHSNQSLTYTSAIYSATETLDARYAGSTTVDTRNVAKIALRGRYEDFQTYTYDSGDRGRRSEEDWYARDTVALYLTPDVEDPQLISRSRSLISKVLRQFLPIQVRPVFIIDPAVHTERVYTYDFPDADPPRRILESFVDEELETISADSYTGPVDGYQDVAPDWVWLRSWREDTADHHIVDVTDLPLDLRYRTWHVSIEAGG